MQGDVFAFKEKAIAVFKVRDMVFWASVVIRKMEKSKLIQQIFIT